MIPATNEATYALIKSEHSRQIGKFNKNIVLSNYMYPSKVS